jgi:hypothetical protein
VLGVADKMHHLIQLELGGISFYIKTMNSNNINRKIRMINEKIRKSFLLILLLTFIGSLANHPTVECSTSGKL